MERRHGHAPAVHHGEHLAGSSGATEAHGERIELLDPRLNGARFVGDLEGLRTDLPDREHVADAAGLVVTDPTLGDTPPASRAQGLEGRAAGAEVAIQVSHQRGVERPVPDVGSDGRDAVFGASGRTISFPGFLRAYVEGSDDPDAALDDQERPLSQMAENDRLDLEELEEAIEKKKLPKLAKEKVTKELKKLKSMPPMSAETTVVRNQEV